MGITRKLLFVTVSIFFLIVNYLSGQVAHTKDEVIIFSADVSLDKPIKQILVLNNVLIKDSICADRILREINTFKEKVKHEVVSKELAESIGLDMSKYRYRLLLINLKDVIIDPEIMKLIRVK